MAPLCGRRPGTRAWPWRAFATGAERRLGVRRLWLEQRPRGFGDVRAERLGAPLSSLAHQLEVVGRDSLERPRGRQLEHEQPQLGARLPVHRGEAGAVGGQHDLVVERLVGLGHRAPGRPAPAAQRRQPLGARWTLAGSAPPPRSSAIRAASTSSAMRSSESPRTSSGDRLLTRAPRFGSICTMPSPWSVRSAERRECRATSYSPLSASSRSGVPGFELPVEDAARAAPRSARRRWRAGSAARWLTRYSIRPWRMPIATACVRVDASSFARMRLVWVRTVSVERPSFSATASVCMPSASI